MKKELTKEEREYRLWEEQVLEYLANPENQKDPEYSDIYKDMYGVRPRFLSK